MDKDHALEEMMGKLGELSFRIASIWYSELTFLKSSRGTFTFHMRPTLHV